MSPSLRSPRSLVLVLAAGLLVAACDKKEGGAGGGPSQPKQPASAVAVPAITAAERAEAKEIFVGRCTPCHGNEGAGDGPASATLTPKPRNFQDAVWQSNVTDEYLAKIIKYGGAAVGKAPMMPANPDLSSKDATVAALVEHVRSLKK